MASLKVVCHLRLLNIFETGDWVRKIFTNLLCAMCNVNNVLQAGHWTAEKCSHLGMLSGAWRLLLSAIPCLDPAQS